MSPEQILDELVERQRARRAEFELGDGAVQDWLFDELADAWRAAQAEATRAYEYWCMMPGADACAVYRAAQDRADQAQAQLAERSRLRRYAEGVASTQRQGASSPTASWCEAGSNPPGSGRALRP
jgi:hypothetical protein